MKRLIKLSAIASLLLMILSTGKSYAVDRNSYISTVNVKGSFKLSAAGRSAPIYISDSDYPGVIRAAKDLQKDITAVTKASPAFFTNAPHERKEVILVGTIGKSKLIDGLMKNGKLNVNGIAGKWETYLIQVVNNPMPGVAKALVIAGSDKRGTIFGIYDLSAKIGVSPWYWWADVPIKEQRNLYVLPGRHTDGEPAVKYRGIFINDEAPAFSGWAKEKFGGVNHQVYEKVFELILRLKGNYLWPAMWGNAFNDDDKADPVLADEYGIVMGTSHHEPMDRAQQEWKRYGSGAWNYETNGEVLRSFWKKGIENMGSKETIVTVGMRGDGDMPMTKGSNIKLLEKIVADQRKIIVDATGKDASQTPQMWALYKEVQAYYDKGMRVPDDVTLLLCDDNWGNIRKLPKLTEPKRKGGYGIYYHFDYVGDPRNYKWLNTNPISKTWEQMHLAYEYGVKQVWVVNVGDLKPMEFPISFFLDYAWSPNKWPASRLKEYTRLWARQQFGKEHENEIADILTNYTKYNSRRKPELLDENTYSLSNYREFETVAADYDHLRDRAQLLYKKIPATYKDAYYELVLHPVEACSNLHDLYFATAKNHLCEAEGNALANDMAKQVKKFYAKDAEISAYYNKTLANGKWNHMMDQTHIGYTYWQQPDSNKMPDVKLVSQPAKASIITKAPGKSSSTLELKNAKGFIERDGYISIEAGHYSRKVDEGNIKWFIIPDYGRTLDGVTISPVTAKSRQPGGSSPHLEYLIYLTDTGKVQVKAYISPTLDFTNTTGLHYAISIDDEQPQIVNINADESPQAWGKNVSDNIKILITGHHINKPGRHILKYWMVDPGVVLQKIVIDAGGEKPSYLGPPESARR